MSDRLCAATQRALGRAAGALVLGLLAGGLTACDLLRPSLSSDPVVEAPPERPESLTATFLGVSTILLRDGNAAVLIDGFLSRPGVWPLVTGGIEPKPERIGYALDRAGLTAEDTIDAILVAHSHYDHAMDSATVAARTGAVVIGSDSTRYVALGQRFPMHLIDVVGHGSERRFGEFHVSVVHLPHAPYTWMERTFLSLEGHIEEPLRTPARLSKYKEGDSFSFFIKHRGRGLLVHPGANFRDGMYRGREADIVFLGIGKLGQQDDCFIERLWDEVVRTTRAKLVIPIHWDDFTRSLRRELKAPPWPLDDVGRAMGEIKRMASRDHVAIAFMRPFEPIDVRRALKRHRVLRDGGYTQAREPVVCDGVLVSQVGSAR